MSYLNDFDGSILNPKMLGIISTKEKKSKYDRMNYFSLKSFFLFSRISNTMIFFLFYMMYRCFACSFYSYIQCFPFYKSGTKEL